MKKTSHSQENPPKKEQETSSATVEKNDAATDQVAAEPMDPITELKAEVEKYRDQALRAVADLENYRKRMTREKEEARRYANSSLLEKLLPILDNFELGLAAAKTSKDEGAANIVSGFSMVQRQLVDFLKDQGLHPIDAEGELFDPKLHDALSHEPHDTIEEGKIIRQQRRGYRLGDRLLRPASVVVSKGQEDQQ